MQSARRKGTLQPLTLLLLLLITLAAGCATCPTMPIKPAKPTLIVERQLDGGICLPANDTYLLLDYIWQLEEGYQ
jgi:hypothetical protein